MLVDTVIDGNKADLQYKVKTNTRYLIDSISTRLKSSDIDSLYKITVDESLIKEGEYFSINKLLLERDRLVRLYRNNGIHDFQQRNINFNVLIDSTGSKKKIPLILTINNKDEESEKEKVMAGKGLYANIHAKRKRGGKMRKKGAKGAPKASDFKRAKQTARKR